MCIMQQCTHSSSKITCICESCEIGGGVTMAVHGAASAGALLTPGPWPDHNETSGTPAWLVAQVSQLCCIIIPIKHCMVGASAHQDYIFVWDIAPGRSIINGHPPLHNRTICIPQRERSLILLSLVGVTSRMTLPGLSLLASRAGSGMSVCPGGCCVYHQFLLY